MWSDTLALTLTFPICLLGTQLCAYVIVANKVVEQPVPFQEVQEASGEQCHGGCLKCKQLWWEGWGFPLEREQQWYCCCSRAWLCVPVTAGVCIDCRASIPGNAHGKVFRQLESLRHPAAEILITCSAGGCSA